MKISIVTICLNDANRIEKTIRSVIQQDYDNIEYIVIDGKSSDNTQKIIKKYKEHISIFNSEPDNGIFDAQNKGVMKSNGDYILILNAGDYLFRNDAISHITNKIAGEDLIYGDIIYEMPSKYKYRKYSPKKINYLNMFVESIPHPATFYKSEIFKKIGFYDLSYLLSADYDLLLKCVFHYNLKYKYCRFPVSVFNLEGASSDKKNKNIFFEERQKIQREYYPKKIFILLKIFSPIIIFSRKKIYYLYFFIRSIFDKNFLSKI